MDKKKTEMIVLIVIVFLGLNYAVYNFYISPKFQKLALLRQENTDKKNRITELLAKKGQIAKIKEENEKIKKQLEEFDKLTSKQLDTPRLAYDFYMSCKKYGLKGEEIKFDLLNKPQLSSAANQAPQQNTPQTNTNSQTGQNTQGQSSNATDLNIAKLSINLKVSGDKRKVEEYIKNLDGVTNRKLNVKTILLSSKSETAENTTPNTSANTAVNPGIFNNITPPVINEEKTFSLVKADQLSLEVVFTQYIQVDPSNAEAISNYEFYDSPIGFESIADMFGLSKGNQ